MTCNASHRPPATLPSLALSVTLAACSGSSPVNDAVADLVGGGDRAVLTGTVTLVPSCSVAAPPIDAPCEPAAELLAAVKLFVIREDATWSQQVDLDAGGRFTVAVDPGSYVIDWSVAGAGPDDADDADGAGPVGFDTLSPPIPPSPGDPRTADSTAPVPSWPDTVWPLPDTVRPLPEPPLPVPPPDSVPGGEPDDPRSDPPTPPWPNDTLPGSPPGGGETIVTLPAAVHLVAGEVRRLRIDIDIGTR